MIICCSYRALQIQILVSLFMMLTVILLHAIDLEKSDLVFLGVLNMNMLPNTRGHKREKRELLNSQLIKESTKINNTSR